VLAQSEPCTKAERRRDSKVVDPAQALGDRRLDGLKNGLGGCCEDGSEEDEGADEECGDEEDRRVDLDAKCLFYPIRDSESSSAWLMPQKSAGGAPPAWVEPS